MNYVDINRVEWQLRREEPLALNGMSPGKSRISPEVSETGQAKCNDWKGRKAIEGERHSCRDSRMLS